MIENLTARSSYCCILAPRAHDFDLRVEQTISEPLSLPSLLIHEGARPHDKPLFFADEIAD